MSRKIENIIGELIEQYLEDDRYNRPWNCPLSKFTSHIRQRFDFNFRQLHDFDKQKFC